jgi:hypothetical protein
MAANFRAVVAAASTPNRLLLHVHQFSTSWRYDVWQGWWQTRRNRARRQVFLLDAISRVDQPWRSTSSYGLLSIQQSANILCNRLVLLKLEKTIIINVY